MKKEVKILLTIAATVLIGFVIAMQFYKDASKSTVSTPVASVTSATTSPEKNAPPVLDERLVRPDSPAKGPENARVVLVEFLDPECESCRAFFPDVKKILSEYPDQIRFVVRYMTFHGNSVLAASATEAAGEQGKYWEMQDLLFTKQGEWSHKEGPQKEFMAKYAQELGLDAQKFAASLSNLMYLQKFERDKEDGTALGVNGTPTFFVNGKMLEELSYASLKKEIDAHLQPTQQ
jgi:protein-disulfide isomerase